MRVKDPQKAVHEVLEIFRLMYRMDQDVWTGERIGRKKRRLMGQVQKFIKSYRVNPIELDGDLLRVEFEGRTNGFRAGAKMHCRLMDDEWVKDLTFPEPQKSLREVFG